VQDRRYKRGTDWGTVLNHRDTLNEDIPHPIHWKVTVEFYPSLTTFWGYFSFSSLLKRSSLHVNSISSPLLCIFSLG
jgi:hypothetical protein